MDGAAAHCRIEPASKCHYVQATRDIGNYIRHFRLKHPEAANNAGLFKEGEAPERKPRVIPKSPIAIDGRLVLEAVLKLVAYHNLPLACVEWEGFKLLLDPLAAALAISLSRNGLKTHLKSTSDRIREAIANEMRYKLISVKIDSASRLNRHVLGINVQYALNGKVVIRTIGKYLLNTVVLFEHPRIPFFNSIKQL